MSGTVLVADDHPLFRQALCLALARVCPDARIVEAGTLGAALRAAQDIKAGSNDLALILLDLKMPGATGYSGIALLHAECPQVPILVVSSAEGAGAAQEARDFGAIGFVSKESDLSAIEQSISLALGGGIAPSQSRGTDDPVRQSVASLTPMQLKVLLAVLNGQLNKQIAHSLSISEATVKAHMTVIMRKLDVSNRTQAALVARALGLELRH